MSNHETAAQQALRALRTDARDGTSLIVGYLNEQGQFIAWTGDGEAPYVRVISSPEFPADVTITPGGSAVRGEGNALMWRQSVAGVAVASVIISDVPARLYQVYFYNNAAATRYLHIFDLAIAPVLGSLPQMPPLPVGAGQYASVDYGVYGMAMGTGISLGCSSTALTFTSAADGVFTAFYELP